jgi:hypothetical protein
VVVVEYMSVRAVMIANLRFEGRAVDLRSQLECHASLPSHPHPHPQPRPEEQLHLSDPYVQAKVCELSI